MDEVSELHSDNPAGDDCRPLAGAGLASGFMVYLKVRNRNKTFFAISEKREAKKPQNSIKVYVTQSTSSVEEGGWSVQIKHRN